MINLFAHVKQHDFHRKPSNIHLFKTFCIIISFFQTIIRSHFHQFDYMLIYSWMTQLQLLVTDQFVAHSISRVQVRGIYGIVRERDNNN
jgi:hypothetical protein